MVDTAVKNVVVSTSNSSLPGVSPPTIVASPVVEADTDATAREVSHDMPDNAVQKSLNAKRLLQATSVSREDEFCRNEGNLLRNPIQSRNQTLREPIQTWVARHFRTAFGEPYPKRFRNAVPVLMENAEQFQIGACKGGRKRHIDATLHYDVHGPSGLEISCPTWQPMERFRPDTTSNAAFTELLKRERLASVCSYHDITTKKEYFHCIWQVENPSKSEFFKKVPGRAHSHANGVFTDVTIPGPIFEGVGGTSWQAIAYPFGYRSNQREGLVGMAVRYNNGPEPCVSAGFQISLLDPSKTNYRGLQETIKDHCTKLQQTSKKSNIFKRGKKGWVLRKFATREQMKKCKRTCLVFVLSFCVYGREQTQFRHRFSKDTSAAEAAISAHMKRLWNNGNPAGKIRMEAKNGKIFRAHSSVLQLNGGVLGHLAANTLLDNPKATLKFPDLTEAVLKKLLEFSYTLQVSGIHKTPFELLLAAHRYGLKGLQDLAQKDVARCIDLDNILDLYVWNESIQSAFLASFISLFLTVNYVNVRQQPEFEEKLTPEQQARLDEKYRALGQSSTELSEGGEGFISEDNDEDDEDDDSGMENDRDLFDMGDYDQMDDDGHGQGILLSQRGDRYSEDQEEANLAEFGEEPEEFQLDMMQHAAHVNVMVNQAEADQAAVIAQIFGDLGGVDPDALDFLMMFM